MSSYDNWLSRPYEEAADREAAIERIWEAHVKGRTWAEWMDWMEGTTEDRQKKIATWLDETFGDDIALGIYEEGLT
jgi:hypothetical protein